MIEIVFCKFLLFFVFDLNVDLYFDSIICILYVNGDVVVYFNLVIFLKGLEILDSGR